MGFSGFGEINQTLCEICGSNFGGRGCLRSRVPTALWRVAGGRIELKTVERPSQAAIETR